MAMMNSGVVPQQPPMKLAPASTKAAAQATATPVPEAGPSAMQAPSLADKVASGDLPALEDRLLAEPIVITPHEKVGIYGGRWRSGSTGESDSAWQTRTMAWEDLLRWKADLSEYHWIV